MICESRIYAAAEGKASALRSRFIDEVAPKFFSRHGIELLGAFVGATEDGRFTYITQFASDRGAAESLGGIRGRPAGQLAREAKQTPRGRNRDVNLIGIREGLPSMALYPRGD